MTPTLIATLGGAGALFLWGVSDWLTSKSSKTHSNAATNLSIQLAAAASLALVLLFSRVAWPAVSDLLVVVLGAAFFTAAYVCYIKALAIGEAGVVVPLGNTYPLTTLLLTFVFLTIPFTTSQIIAFIIIATGAILLGAEKVTGSTRWRRRPSKAAVYASITAFFWGAGFFTISLVVDGIAWQVVSGVMLGAMACFALLIFLVQTRRQTAATRWRPVVRNSAGLSSGVFLAIGTITFYIGVEKGGSMLIPTVIAAASPLITALLAHAFDKERIAAIKWAGALLAVVGVIFLNV